MRCCGSLHVATDEDNDSDDVDDDASFFFFFFDLEKYDLIMLYIHILSSNLILSFYFLLLFHSFSFLTLKLIFYKFSGNLAFSINKQITFFTRLFKQIKVFLSNFLYKFKADGDGMGRGEEGKEKQ